MEGRSFLLVSRTFLCIQERSSKIAPQEHVVTFSTLLLKL